MEQTALFSTKEEKSKEKIKALDELFKRSSVYNNSTKFFELLKFIKRFPSLSPFNAFLIHTQNPGVEFVMNESKWLRFGRKVISYARPLVILVPFGPVEFVYDIKDTEGESSLEELTNPFATKGNFDRMIYYKTIKNALKENVVIDEKEIANAAAGYVRNKKNHFDVTINSTWDVNVKYSTLIHELGHIYCGHAGVINRCWWKDRSKLAPDIKEIEAESVSYLVCARVGLETSSESYLSEYIKNQKIMPLISLDTILTVAGYIEQLSLNTFKPKKPGK